MHMLFKVHSRDIVNEYVFEESFHVNLYFASRFPNDLLRYLFRHMNSESKLFRLPDSCAASKPHVFPLPLLSCLGFRAKEAIETIEAVVGVAGTNTNNFVISRDERLHMKSRT